MWAFFFLTWNMWKLQKKSDCIILCHVRLSPTVCACVCMCELYSERTSKVAPETSLQVSNRALLKLQSAQSRCGFQAFIHAEKLQLTYMLPILALLFHAHFIFAFQNLSFLVFFSHFFFFYSYLKFPPGHKVLHSTKDFYSRSLGVGQPVDRRGHFLVCGRGGKNLFTCCMSQ